MIRTSFVAAAFAVFSLQAAVLAPAQADWAIAFGQKGSTAWAYGTAWNHDSLASARKKALSNCRDNGPNCKIVLDGTGGCVALAVGLDDNAWAAQQNKSKRNAAKIATDECLKNSVGDCEVKDSFCEE